MSNDTREVFKNNLKKYRLAGKQNGLQYCKSAKTFAEYINVNYNAYIDYERKGKFPPLDILIKIAYALCVSIDTLLEYAPPDTDTVRFLTDLKFDFDTEIKDGEPYFILYTPAWLKEIHVNPPTDIIISFEEMETAIEDFNSLNTVTDIRLKSLNFFRFVSDYNELYYNELHNKALEADKFTQEILKERESYYYGYKDFRGGNIK